MINHVRDILQEMFENSSLEMNNEKSEEENKWGSWGEYMGTDVDQVLEKKMDMILMKVNVMWQNP